MVIVLTVQTEEKSFLLNLYERLCTSELRTKETVIASNKPDLI